MVALLFQETTYLEHLVLWVETTFCDQEFRDGMLSVAERMRDQPNMSLKTLQVLGKCPTITKVIAQAFVEVLQVNHHLVLPKLQVARINVSLVGREDYEELKFWNRLNQSGRGALVTGGHSKSAWVEKLIQVSHCPSSLFFYLSANPALCEGSMS